MQYYVIGDEDTVLGFGMVGVQGNIVRTREKALEMFQAALQNKDIGIIIITEKIAELIRTTVDKYLFTVQFPLIVEIPDRTGPALGRLGIRDMVNAAIGIKL
jgi:V/A-type H+-transporting ATPase subunit F